MRGVIPILAAAFAAFATAPAVAQTADVIIELNGLIPVQAPTPAPPIPVGDVKKPVVVLLEDDAHLIHPHLTNDGEYTENIPVGSEDADVFSEASALRVGTPQRFRANVPGWSFPIVEKPKAGEFRFIRFAWKKVGGNGIMLQFHDPEKSWFVRYHAGTNSTGWASTEVTKEVPTGWTVVTRDLFADFGAMTLTGIAFTAMDGTHALFDHVLFGRTVEDLDAATDAALGKVKPKTPLGGKEREAAWADLWGRERDKAGPAVSQFLASAADQVGFVRAQLTTGSGLTAEQMKAREKAIAKRIADLNADKFDTRETAEDELEKLGSAAEGAIVAALKSDSAEVRFRANRLTGKLKLDGDTPMSTVRAARVVRVLEKAGNADAKALLKGLSDGEYGAEYQPAARTALARLK